MYALICNLIIFLCFILIGCDNKEINNIIKIGVITDYPPFGYIKNGKPTGFDIEFAKLAGSLITKKTKDFNFSQSNNEILSTSKVDIKIIKSNEILKKLENNDVDMVIASTVIFTEEQAKLLNFAYNYYEQPISIIYRKDKTILFGNDITVGEIKVATQEQGENAIRGGKKRSDTCTTLKVNNYIDKKVIAQLGTISEFLVKKIYHLNQIVLVGDMDFAIQCLKCNDVVAILTDTKSKLAEQLVNQNSELETKIFSSYKRGYSIIVKKNSALAYLFEDKNNAFYEWVHKGNFNELNDKWLTNINQNNMIPHLIEQID